ncbi:MAG: hypothetical protein ACJAZ9_000557 [Neolewinella sp.]|jgi:membrane protein implicated in regulation of membrane protease activity
MFEILNYIAMLTGGLLVLLMVLSLVGGLDLDLDFDTDAGGFGIVKSVLTFVSIGTWTAKAILVGQSNPVMAIVVGAAAGAVAVYILSQFLRFLLRQQSNVNWSPVDALAEQGRVYLPIPASGEGVVTVRIKGRQRELKAKSLHGSKLSTGTTVVVDDVDENGILVVSEA